MAGSRRGPGAAPMLLYLCRLGGVNARDALFIQCLFACFLNHKRRFAAVLQNLGRATTQFASVNRCSVRAVSASL